ncbi:hypothetical protein ACFYE2_00470 [Kocuria sp. CPCC 205300]|uniref:phage tail tube protein n=1 Tax=Kocuria sabuli TaxID=3071448 RepID=UPI0036D8AE72
MALRDIANLRSFGDWDCDVFVGKELGVPKPTNLEDLGVDWDSLGWMAESGAEEGLDVSNAKFTVWQGAKTAKTKTTGTEKTMQVEAAETNPVVFGLWYGAAPATTDEGTGISELEIPDGVPTVARPVAFKFVEGDIIWIRYNTRAEITDRGSVSYTNGDLATRQMTFDLVGKDYWLTNDPAFASTPATP